MAPTTEDGLNEPRRTYAHITGWSPDYPWARPNSGSPMSPLRTATSVPNRCAVGRFDSC